MARRRGSRRTRRMWVASLATVVGLAVVGGIGWYLDRLRDTDLGDPRSGVTTAFEHQIPDEAPDLRFRDVARDLGVVMRHGPGPRSRSLPEDTGSGLAWSDYDGDGDDDLYVVSFPGPSQESTEPGSNRLFRNDGSAFVDVTDVAGIGDPEGFGMGAAFADFDEDGDDDLFVTNHGPNRLFKNRGDGTFEEVASEAGLAHPAWAVGATWGDLDRNGRLDLYVANYVVYDEEVTGVSGGSNPEWEGVPFTLNPNAFDPEPNLLYLQSQDGRFREAALELGASDPTGRSLGAVSVDLDDDGWLDLYVANDVSPNALLLNLAGTMGGTPLFDDASSRTGTADPRGSMGMALADLPGADGSPDGLPDLFISHWVAQENALYQAVREPAGLEYRDRTRNLRLAEISTEAVGWGCAFVDLDLDGRVDLAVANGSTLEENPSALQAQTMFLFWNDGVRFHDATSGWGDDAARNRVARGLGVADWDRDGDPDLAVSVNRGSPILLENEGDPRGHWLAVRLPRRAATVAARVTATIPDGPSQSRWHAADVSYASQHAAETIFGLASTASATITVEPISGAPRRLEDLPVDRRIVVRPPEG